MPNDNLWKGVAGTNNPCPPGWRLPTMAELDAEYRSWNPRNAAGAYGSTLKWPVGGYREGATGSLLYEGSYGYVWNSGTAGYLASFMLFNYGGSSMYNFFRANGYSVRCVRDL